MTDLQNEINPKSNIYFRNPRIRRYLIRAGLINRHGDILPPTSVEVAVAPSIRGQRTKDSLSKNVNNHAVKEEQKRQAVVRSQVDLPVKSAHVKKNKKSRQSHRSNSPNSLKNHGSRTPTNERHPLKRAKSAYHASHNFRKPFVRSAAKKKPLIKERCRVIMIYYGPQTIIDYDTSWYQPEGDEILIMQQHCGGENLAVFKGRVKTNETFAFDSLRHPDYPFALAIYINGLIDSRISVCCEYKHKRNVPLGGPHGLFGISDVQRVKPCSSCQYKRNKKKSKSKSSASLVIDSSRYRKSIVPRPIPNSPQTEPPIESRTSLSAPEEDDKKPPISSSDANPSAVQTNQKSNTQSPPGFRSSPPILEDDDKKPLASSSKTNPPVVQIDYKLNIQSPSVSRTSSSSSAEEDDQKPLASSSKPNPPAIRTVHKSNIRSPSVSRTPSSTSDEDDKKTLTPSSESYAPIVGTGDNSKIKNPPISQHHDNEEYSLDFDESSDGDHLPKNSRFDRPRISDPNSIDRDQRDNNTQSTSSLSSSRTSSSSDDRDNHYPFEKLTGTTNTIRHSRKSSASIPKKFVSAEDEDNNHALQLLLGKNSVAGDSRRSSSSTSRKSGPPSSDKVKREFNKKDIDNRFPSNIVSKNNIEKPRVSLSSEDDTSTKLSAKLNEDIDYPSQVRRVSSSLSEEFFGIKPSSSGEKKKVTEVFSKDWFKSNSKTDLNSPAKTSSWMKDIVSD